MTEKLQCREHGGLAADQHDDPFEQVDLVGFHRCQELPFEGSQVASDFHSDKRDFVTDSGEIAPDNDEIAFRRHFLA